ncbi:MAG: NADH-ubiquinone oxidoreductase-F iron-sulfur binding region domain-containing protein [Thermodesulfobacteriota bacterium]
MPEKTLVLNNCGVVDPASIDSYLARDGFKALARARTMSPEGVIEVVKDSRLLGRGGAGFAAGLKWDLARRREGAEKFVICNADEGEMGTFKDRFIIQKDPFGLIEAIVIACYAVGASKAYIYLRSEYAYLKAGLTGTIRSAAERGYPGGISIQVALGAGAYVCGEETALMNSIEGRRGEARYKPPFPPEAGLWGTPTLIHNVETLLNIPSILLKGAEWFRGIGTPGSKGTKVFSVSGDVARPGVYELEMGSTLSELLALAGARDVKMVQVGGAAGRMIPVSQKDIPLCFETVLGSGAVMVYDQTRDVIDIVHRTMEFFASESCGKCTPCREGTELMVEITERLSRAEGTVEDIAVLEDLSTTMTLASLCGLGQAAPLVVQDTLTHFRKDYETRIEQSRFLKAVRGR